MANHELVLHTSTPSVTTVEKSTEAKLGGAGGSPPVQTKRKPAPTKEELQKHIDDGWTVRKLGFRYGRSAETVKRWLKGEGLSKSPEPPQEPQRQEEPSTAVQLLEHDDQDDVLTLEDDEQTERKLAHPNSPNSPNEQSAFDKLNNRQQRAAIILAGLQHEDLEMTAADAAQAAGCTAETLRSWRRDPVFREAVAELGAAEFAHEATVGIRRRLLKLMKDGKERPEDRKLIAELAGLLSSSSITNVQVNIDTALGRRFRA